MRSVTARFPTPLPLLLALTAALLAGCGPIYLDFAYEPNELEGAAPTELKIAILPLEDRRETHDRGSKAWSYLPLVPFATERRDRAQAPRERHAADYFFPDLIPYTLAVDLVANGVSPRVDIAPPALEDYDLVIHGVLHSTEQYERRISYGLGFLSFVTVWVGAPQGSQGVELDVTYSTYDVAGQRLSRQRYAEQWSMPSWGTTLPQMQGVVETVHDLNRHFAASLMTEVVGSIGDPAAARDRRIRLYHERLDPELPVLLAERDRVRALEGSLYREYERDLQAEVLKRARNLEKWRRAEALMIARQQQHVYETQQVRLEQIAQLRSAKRAAKAKREAAQRAHDQAISRSLAGAVLAGVLPTYQAASAQGGRLSEHQQSALAQDLAAAMAAMPPPPPPPPDTRDAEARLRLDMEGLASPGALLEGIPGNDLREKRQVFLSLYAGETRSLDRIKASFMARHRR